MSGNINVLGLDLSLTATGVAEVIRGSAPTVRTLTPPRPASRGHERLAWICAQIWDAAWQYEGGHLVVIEGPSYGSQASQAGHHERAGLWWLVVHKLWSENIHVAVAPPTSLKKYATGKGNAAKEIVFAAAVRRWPDLPLDNNSADALWLAAMGCEYVGQPIALVGTSVNSRAALGGVQWPPEVNGG